MKKRLFSTLLMGAFFIASMSMFTSCKDYDDDINAVQTDVDALKKQVDALETARTNLLNQIDELRSSLALKLDASAASEFATKTDIKQFATKAELENAINDLKGLFSAYVTLEKLNELIASATDLEKRVAANEAKIEELQKLVDAISGVDPALLTLPEAVENLKTVINDPATGLAAVNTQLGEQAKLLADLKATVDALSQGVPPTVDLSAYAKTADLTAAINDVLAKIGSNTTLIEALQQEAAKITTVQTDITNIQQQLSGLSGVDVKISTLEQFMNGIQTTILNTIKANASVITVYVSSSLSSLVLKPTFYLNGIETIGVPMLVYQPVLEIVNGEYARGNAMEAWTPVTKPVVTDYDIHWPEGMNLIATAITGGLDYNTLGYKLYQNFPNPHAYYHINPENSDLTGATVKLYTNYPEVTETRATGTPEVIGTPVETTISAAAAAKAKATGIYDLEFNVPTQLFVNVYVKNFVDSWDAARGIGIAETTGKVPFVAAAVSQTVDGASRTISSDWAALFPWLMHINALADNAPDIELARSWSDVDQNMVTRNHLYMSAKEAIDGEATHEVVYNGSIDLAPFIETHFSYVGAAYNKDQVMSQELMDAMGLYYEYMLVDYDSNNYETEESHHAELDGSVLYPRSVNEDGSTITGKVATKEAVDREPLVRVVLKAKKPGVHGAPASTLGDEEILKVGYIKLRIVETVKETISLAIDFKDPIYMNCPGVGFLTWSQIENKILAKVEELGLPKFDFDSEYRLEINPNYAPSENGGAVRYVEIDGRFMNEADYIKYLEKKYKTDDDFLIEDLVNKNIEFAHAYFKAFAGLVNYTNEPTSLFPNDWKNKETNVIYWILGADHSAHAHSYMTGSTIPSYVDQAYVTYLAQPDADGLSTNDITTTIRFNHIAKSNKSIFVTLRIPAGNLRYATAYLDNKNYHEWYQLNSVTGATSNENAREVHVNVPVPQLQDGPVINYTRLMQKDFGVDLMQFFSPRKDGSQEHFVKFTLNEPDKFYRFAAIHNGLDQENVSFWLTTPSVAKGNITNKNEGLNYFDATINTHEAQAAIVSIDGVQQPAKVWTVRGYSGDYYTLAVANRKPDGSFITYGVIDVVDNREIYEYKNVDPEVVPLERGNYVVCLINGTAIPIVSLLDTNNNILVDQWDTPAINQVRDNPVVNEYIRFHENQVAEDILNWKTFDRGLNKEVGEFQMFTAYVEAVYTGACYELYDKFEDIHNTFYFNVRFQRPINFYPLDITGYIDGPNSGIYINFMDFLEQENASNKHFAANKNTVIAATDWRTYKMIRDNGQTGGKASGGFFGSTAVPAQVYKLGFAEPFVLWSYYRFNLDLNTWADPYKGVGNLHANTNGDPSGIYRFTPDLVRYIRTDATELDRTAISPDTPEGRAKIHALPLAASRMNGLMFDDGLGNAGLNLATGGDPTTDGLLHYQNNKGNTKLFHLYVPIYYYYVFGESDSRIFRTGSTLAGNQTYDISVSPWHDSVSPWDYFRKGEPFAKPAMTYGVITIDATTVAW